MAAAVLRTSGDIVSPLPTNIDRQRHVSTYLGARPSVAGDSNWLNESLDRVVGQNVVLLKAARRGPVRLVRTELSVH